MAGFKTSERRACKVLRVSRSTIRYCSCKDPQDALRLRLRDLAAARVRWGYPDTAKLCSCRLHVLLGREGWKVNPKRIYRLYKQEGLELRLKTKKKRVALPRVPCPPAAAPNERWSLDFVSDRLADGRPYRVLTLVDNASRVSPDIEVDFSLTGRHVTQVLDRATARYGMPKAISVDNGPEFSGRELDAWAHRKGVTLCFSRPGKPTDNAFVESFNGRLRQECLNTHWFETIREAQAALEAWREGYNTQRPHSSLGLKTPAEFAAGWKPPEPASELANSSS